MPGDSDERGPDLSMSAVNQRLSAFVAEVRARPEGEQRPFAESDKLLAKMCENALAYQAEGERLKAEAQAKVERMEYEQRGGRVQ
jgi:hypothetical protein